MTDSRPLSEIKSRALICAGWLSACFPGEKMKRSLTSAALLASFVFTLALAASPHLHEQIHSNARHADHECAVTMMLRGGCDNAPPPKLGVALFRSDPVAILALEVERAVSSETGSRLRSRGPPALG